MCVGAVVTDGATRLTDDAHRRAFAVWPARRRASGPLRSPRAEKELLAIDAHIRAIAALMAAQFRGTCRRVPGHRRGLLGLKSGACHFFRLGLQPHRLDGYQRKSLIRREL